MLETRSGSPRAPCIYNIVKKNIRLTAALLAVIALYPAAQVYETPAYSVSAAQTKDTVSDAASALFSSLAKKLLDATPSLQPGSIGGDWSVMILAKAGLLTDDMADKYYSNVVEYVSLQKGILSTSRSTDYSRVICARSIRARPFGRSAGMIFSPGCPISRS